MAKWCTCWAQEGLPGVAAARAALLNATRWPTGTSIAVRFIGGDPAVRERVKNAAKKWTKPDGGPANLHFNFVDDADTADIRIGFTPGGSWSVLGTTCRKIKAPAATMNFGWLTPDTPEEELRRVVLHEFGHALGLVHEHLSPAIKVNWNKERVYQDLKESQGWSRDKVDTNMFQVFDQRDIVGTPFDPKSVMLYVIPPEWTTDGFSTVLNTALSDRDKDLIREVYP